ncbi:SDR family NAD(P)-dependent oxidoreductase [Mycobacterium sp. 236(2023)]|uniref:SDR family NAD(P)-dependent oxidoreductase n=1 Tax=Mycobacterium sp. 236(2023) TaxID=3038163 RepID=UPI0024159067|nr:SDR family NAD(P)-dependent oxidoreductase [Mycobacterium sp. 236(2023)]MDG4668174.1 SDR family NAD(P)-dependent oxidoreductase [Mycobacterium sp. 236(2023)]
MRSPRTALVTGASRGLGRASVVELIGRGWHVLGAMRSPDRDGPDLVGQVSGLRGDLELVRLDLDSDASIRAVGGLCTERVPDALIHIAGLAPSAAFEDIPHEERVSTLQTNLLGPMLLTELLLPAMRARGTGRIVAVASLAARIGLPLASVYGASKAGLERWIEGLATEIHQFGLSAHVIESGMFATDMMANSDVPAPEGPYGPMYAKFSKRRAGVVAKAKPAEQFARALADFVERPKAPVLKPVGTDAIGAYYAQRLIPAGVISTALKHVVKP